MIKYMAMKNNNLRQVSLKLARCASPEGTQKICGFLAISGLVDLGNELPGGTNGIYTNFVLKISLMAIVQPTRILAFS